MDQLGNTALALLQHPEQMGLLRDNPEPVRSAIEEGLRYDGTAQLTQRVAREDLVVRGKTIRKGEMLQLALGAANRDPEVFVEPDRFEISRAHNPHLAFGSRKPDTHHPHHPAVVNRSMAAAAPAHECVRHVALVARRKQPALPRFLLGTFDSAEIFVILFSTVSAYTNLAWRNCVVLEPCIPAGARRDIVDEDRVGVYHLSLAGVLRRAFLCGEPVLGA